MVLLEAWRKRRKKDPGQVVTDADALMRRVAYLDLEVEALRRERDELALHVNMLAAENLKLALSCARNGGDR